MNRRDFLQKAAASTISLALAPCRQPFPAAASTVITVTGPVRTQDLGVMLPHEHVLVDFIGADQVSPERYDRAEAFQVALPFLKRLYERGGRTLVECTPAYLGRDPLLLKQLARASGLYIVTNTGYYGARDDRHLPPHAFTETPAQLAARWVREFREGIGETGVRPGFMKIGVDPGHLSAVDRKLIQAAALAHLDTGMIIAAHTGPAEGAFDQIEVLKAEGVNPSAWIWVHAQGEADGAAHVQAARAGAWVSFDGLSPDSIEQHLEFVLNMRAHDLLDHVLLSHDAGWYHVGEPKGGVFRPFDTLFEAFIPALQQAGLGDDEVHRLIVANPARAFAIGVRRT